MKELKHLDIDLRKVFEKVASDCDLDTSTVRYCLHRLNKEGLKFWTVTLPKLAKHILKSIEAGHFILSKDDFTCIAWQGRSLRFFRSLLKRIFCLKTGELLNCPDPAALANLRQILEYVYKLALDFTLDQQLEAHTKLHANQETVGSYRIQFAWAEALRKNAETHYSPLFKVQTHEILAAAKPRFGPGAFSSIGISNHSVSQAPHYLWKQLQHSLVGSHYSGLDGHSGYFKPYPAAPTRLYPVGSEKTTTVHFVPKDSRGPRIISAEPPHLIKAQMAFFGCTTALLEKVSSYRINFEDQTVNRRLARESSVTRENATLDLKDASDMIPFSLIKHITQFAPGLRFFINELRSTRYISPITLQLYKDAYKCSTGALKGAGSKISSLAGMGSGLTFPILAFLVHLSVCTCVSSTLAIPYKQVASKVYVYGDDLIVPSEWTDLAKQGLRASGLAVNSDKSYVKGPFRESCGGDYLNGIEVSPIRLKLQNAGLSKNTARAVSASSNADKDPRDHLRIRMHKHSKEQANFIIGLCKHAQELRKAGRTNTAAYYENLLEGVIPMPYVGEGSPILGRYTEDALLIIKQGVGSGSGCGTSQIKGVVSRPIKHKTLNQCPYKYMGEFLGSNDPLVSLNRHTVSYIRHREVASVLSSSFTSQLKADSEGSLNGRVYGEIPIPRKNRLVFRTFSTTEALAKDY